jgi:hypothetical protein
METHAIKRRRVSPRWAASCAVAVLFAAGCSRMEDTTANFTQAINSYYSSHPSCIWPEAIEFPLQESTLSSREISGYDALVHQSLLVRNSGPAKVTAADGSPGNTYDLSPKGRATWSADPKQPGFGNFCYGHRVVTSIDSSTPTSRKNGATTDVVYRYTVSDAPDWAKAAEVQADFPALQGDLSGKQVGRATLTDSRKGWQVTSAPWAHIPDSDIYK